MIYCDEEKTAVYGKGTEVMSEFMTACVTILKKVDIDDVINVVKMAEKIVELGKQGIDVDKLSEDEFAKVMDAILSVTRGDYDA